jgi:hypothetical protein
VVRTSSTAIYLPKPSTFYSPIIWIRGRLRRLFRPSTIDKPEQAWEKARGMQMEVAILQAMQSRGYAGITDTAGIRPALDPLPAPRTLGAA